ncbi:MAG TPA: hypothetical protein VLJ60_04635 [bacterium]|nr:hypothetical protein [bacterium]
MKTVSNLTEYIEETLGIRPVLRKESRAMPLFITNLYYLYESTLIDLRVLFIIDKCNEELTPASVKKHISAIREKWGSEVIYVKDTLSSFNRKRLIEHKIPFIIPGNQMYLPMTGIDLREYFRKSILEKTVFSPSTQMFLLSAIINNDNGQHCPKNAAENLGYSQMTFTRVFDELETEGIGIHSTSGKERFLTFEENKKELWEKIKPYLRSPVKKRMPFYGEITEKMYKAGLSALSDYSMIAEISPAYAISSDVWKEIDRKKSVIKERASIENEVEIEIWKYDPGFLSKNGIVDPFSLYLCLRDNKDERIQSAIEQMMENYKW